MRIRHDVPREHAFHAQPGSGPRGAIERALTRVPGRGRSRTTGAFAVLAIAATIAITAARYLRHDPHGAALDAALTIPRLSSAASQDCSARYAALLDLAELARRDGKASDVVMRGLGDRHGALNGCLAPVAPPPSLVLLRTSRAQNASPLDPAARSNRIP